MTSEEIRSITNATFSGLTFFCRDVALDESLIDKYQRGQMLMEKGFTDMSHKIAGMVKNCRYLIATSNWKDLSKFSPNPELGHAVISSGAYFKILDIQKENGKTQLLLLNIPKEAVALFSSSTFKVEDQIIEKGKEIFNKSIASEPHTELQSKEWIERTSFPLGMSQDGDFFMK